MNPRFHIDVLWRVYMALRTYIRNVHEVEVVVTISVSVIFFVDIPGMICMMCCTWYDFVVALKVHKASSAQNRGGLPTKYIHIYLNIPDQEQRFENHAW